MMAATQSQLAFSQVGAESDWRTANTESMKSTFSEENGYELIFDDAQQKQENQLTAIRNFIQREKSSSDTGLTRKYRRDWHLGCVPQSESWRAAISVYAVSLIT